MWALVVASGPSLRRADVDLIRPCFGYCVAVNCAVMMAPWADVLYAADEVWWKTYNSQLRWFKGERYTLCPTYPGAKHYRPDSWSKFGRNSGHQALQFTIDRGCKKVALIGFDFQRTGGKAHYHGDHPAPMGNANRPEDWIDLMNDAALEAEGRGVEIVNLTRQTALTCFPQMSVEAFNERFLT